jgi:hypothetical protein
MRHRRWESISHLPVRVSLAACKLPVIGETLKPGNHRNGEARHAHKIASWRFIRYKMGIHA